MVIGYELTLAGRAGAGGVASSMDDAVTAVTAALRASYGSEAPEVLAGILTRSWGPLRASMATDGADALRSAGEWRGSAPGIAVTLWAL
jgi:hypothetical protein